MSDERVQRWLEKKLAREAQETLLLAVGILAGAIVVLAITFGICYASSLFVLLPTFHLHSRYFFWIALSMVALLFVAARFSNREELTEYHVESVDGGPVHTFYIPHVGIVSNLNPFSAANAAAFVKIIADLVLSGPRFVSAAWQTFQRSQRLKRMDVALLAEVFTLLLSAGRRVSLAEILPRLGHCDPSEVFRQLSEIEGVVFLNSPPPGISLTADLRQEFFAEIKAMADAHS